MPSLFVITGSNGAGKSTTAVDFVPDHLPVFDGDKLKLVKQKEFDRKLRNYKAAGKMADEFVDQEFIRLYKTALQANADFAYEGHFSEAGSWGTIAEFKSAGYRVYLFFLGLNSVELSMERVFERAISGGHNVPENQLLNNYYGNLEGLNNNLPLLDEVYVLDSSLAETKNLLEIKNGMGQLNCAQNEIPEWTVKYLPNLLNMCQALKTGAKKTRGKKL